MYAQIKIQKALASEAKSCESYGQVIMGRLCGPESVGKPAPSKPWSS
jgi:hypothetical protein